MTHASRWLRRVEITLLVIGVSLLGVAAALPNPQAGTKQLIVDKPAEDTIYSRNFDTYPCRVMKTPGGKRYTARPLSPPVALKRSLQAAWEMDQPMLGLARDALSHGTVQAVRTAYFGAATLAMRKAMHDGNHEDGVQLIGQSQGLVHDVASVAEIVARVMAQAQSVLKRRSAVFVVSDFISPPGWEKPLAQLARRHEVVAVRLRDPLEMAWPDNTGMLLVQDAESGEQLLVDGNDAAFRQRFAQHAQEREAALLSSLSQAGVDCLELNTDEALDQALLRFAQLRKRASQLSTGGRATPMSTARPTQTRSPHA